MSTISDFNRIEDCDKINAKCVDGYSNLELDGTNICLDTSWGQNCVDIAPVIKTEETCTTMYLSPAESPNCLVYEPECGDNVCIHGDDLSRIISMQKLKDVSQTEPAEGVVYMYNEQTNLFEPYDLKTAINNINTALTNINAAITALQNRMTAVETTVSEHETRIQALETMLTPPEGAPSNVKVTFANINAYSDHNAQIDGSGNIVSLDKSHGFYTHSLNTNVNEDEIFG